MLYAEDPDTPGDEALGENERRQLGATVISKHYASIAQKIGQQILASSLSNHFTVPDEIQFTAIVWEFRTPPLKGKRFVGGYYSPDGIYLSLYRTIDDYWAEDTDSLRLDGARATFFGIEENIFRQIIQIARMGLNMAAQVQQFGPVEPFYSAISVHRDGTIIGPVEFFRPIERVRY